MEYRIDPSVLRYSMYLAFVLLLSIVLLVWLIIRDCTFYYIDDGYSREVPNSV